ncbi:uncharacterized protein C2845_PM15G14330 [Panicum miliaceum]|uniref:Uncharacterized protein n=1 Tax=Panicum miliaceum TaxID=4540 RepID=A0A3L6Q4F3_PANMI|nr:uncharacterized protein C2845_PM15G14330 [Panicum miliaceum]
MPATTKNSRWRLAGFRRQHGLLEEPLIENAQAENEIDPTYWLPSWFFLSVAAMTFWCWFFWGASKIPKAESAGSWLWSDLNMSIQIMIPFTIILSIVWLVWLCLINYKKTLLCVARGTLGFIIVCGSVLFFKGYDRLHVLGIVAVALTVASNFCRMKSSLSSTAGSLFRGRDFVILMILRAGEPRNLHVNIEQSWFWFLQKVASGSRSLQLKMGRTWLQFRHQVAGSTDAQI